MEAVLSKTKENYSTTPRHLLQVIGRSCRTGEGVELDRLRSFAGCLNSEVSYNPSHLREGLESILLTDPAKGLNAIIDLKLWDYFFPEFTKLAKMQLDRRSYDAGVTILHHLIEVCAGIELIGEGTKWEPSFHERNLVRRYAALLHDIGKLETARNIGHGTAYPKHAEVGAPMADKFLRRLGYAESFRKQVCLLVEVHMAPYTALEERADRKTLEALSDDAFCDLMALNRADAQAPSRKRKRHVRYEALQELRMVASTVAPRIRGGLCIPLDEAERNCRRWWSVKNPSAPQLAALRAELTKLTPSELQSLHTLRDWFEQRYG